MSYPDHKSSETFIPNLGQSVLVDTLQVEEFVSFLIERYAYGIERNTLIFPDNNATKITWHGPRFSDPIAAWHWQELFAECE